MCKGISNLCRICLETTKNGTSLFSQNEESEGILSNIYLNFQIILNYDKKLPSVICGRCSDELTVANNFRIKCLQFEEKFTNISNQLTSKIFDENILYPNLPEEAFVDSEADVCVNLKEYAIIDNIESKSKFTCNICSKVLKTELSLKKHKSIHEKRKHVGKVTGTGVNRRYHCIKCPYVTPHSQTLVNHMRRHDGERPYRCDCGKSFTQSSTLATHKKTHSFTTYFTCSTCGKQFKHAFTLKNHLRVHNTGTFSCSVCQKILKSQSSLREHMQRHYNIRNFSCEDCGATFVSSSDLSNHRKKHSTEKRAECHLCGYKTRAKKNLILHLKRHVGDKKFKCELCDINVYTGSDLRRHRRVHTREKPYPCPACAQRFSHSTSLNKHMRNIHNVHYKWGNAKSLPSKSMKDEEISNK